VIILVNLVVILTHWYIGVLLCMLTVVENDTGILTVAAYCVYDVVMYSMCCRLVFCSKVLCLCLFLRFFSFCTYWSFNVLCIEVSTIKMGYLVIIITH
jgi:hypothetical protein